jgi:hypothetical protein
MTVSFDQYTTQGERTVARKLVRAALAAGCAIDVNDGMEWTVKRATMWTTVSSALATTGEDTLRLRDANDDYAGSFSLIWGNADDGSELIADHTDNALCNRLWAQAMGEKA